MAARYVSTNNSRGNTVTAMNPTYAHIRGWDIGVETTIERDGRRLDVWLTGGSNGHGARRHLGTAKLNETGGRDWSPDAETLSNDQLQAAFMADREHGHILNDATLRDIVAAVSAS